MDKQHKDPKVLETESGDPETAEEYVNKYGTYNIQPTSDTDNVFPTIAAGLPKCDDTKRGG